MAFSVVMPALEMAQETGKLLAWRKKEGDRVAKGEPLLEIETDKAVVEVEAPADGVLAGIKASEGTDIPVGQTIAWIVAPGEQPPEESVAPAVPPARAVSQRASHAPHYIADTSRSAQAAAPKISPKARRLAKDLGVDINKIVGSGASGEILASDIQAVANMKTSTVPAKDSEKIELPTSIGRIMAERTTQAWTTVPHFFVRRDVDSTALNHLREKLLPELNRTHGIRITHTDLLVKLVARVLRSHPRLNASWTEAGIRLHRHVNITLAIAVNDGVVATTIRDADSLTLADIAAQRRDLSERAKQGKLRPADIADATFTISNLGMYEVDEFCAIITSPQAAILAVGAIRDRVIVADGQPAIRPIMTLTLSCDHRVVDGARAAMFLRDLAATLSHPETLA
ncbi:MAG TPA: dihydrolipoamide acetyltransferase family protein [Verrucomicrobiae bacterium]|nr:dihydrolipoamide acetyltransferase family protein [Verrucomicrobiae bacterium]